MHSRNRQNDKIQLETTKDVVEVVSACSFVQCSVSNIFDSCPQISIFYSSTVRVQPCPTRYIDIVALACGRGNHQIDARTRTASLICGCISASQHPLLHCNHDHHFWIQRRGCSAISLVNTVALVYGLKKKYT